jgi:hypothetical protein
MIFQFAKNVTHRQVNTQNGPMDVYEQRGYAFAPGAEFPMPFDVRVDGPKGFEPRPAVYRATESSLKMGDYGALEFVRGLALEKCDDNFAKWWQSCPVKD